MRRRPERWWVASLAWIVAAGACGDEPAPPPRPTSHLTAPPVVTDWTDPQWSGGSSSEVVARVNGAAIPLALLRDQVAARPDVPPRELLDRLIELEVMAQQAVTEGLADAPEVRSAWRGAMAAAFLKTSFEARHKPSDITPEMVQQIFQRVRSYYDHADAWKMAHLAIACCDPKIESCSSERAVRCFADAAFTLQQVYDELKPRLDPLADDPVAVAAAMKDFQTENQDRFGEVFFEEVSFFYDPAKPHSEQRGYNLVAEAVARTVIDAPMGVLQRPVQSSFGWHAIVKLEHRAEERRGPDDPEVAAEIRARAFPKMQRALYHRDVAGLRKQYDVRVDPAPLELLGQVAGGQAP